MTHGYHAGKELMRGYLEMFPHDTVLMFDFRAHGESEGKVISLGNHEQKDILAAIDFLKTRPETKDLPLYGFGASMGAVSLFCTAVKTDAFKALILDSGFADLYGQMSREFSEHTSLPQFPFLNLSILCYRIFTGKSVYNVSPISCAPSIKIPVFIAHARNDIRVLFKDSEKLYESLGGPKEFFPVKNAPHAKLWLNDQDEYRKRVEEFLRKVEK